MTDPSQDLDSHDIENAPGWASPYPYQPAEAGRSAGTPSRPDAELEPAIQRRITVAVCWALARRAALDGRELYEDSFALNEEFREWLLCLDEHPDVLAANLLMVPTDLHRSRRPETDGLLEI